MGNLINTIKKFLSNKNTVTILGILAGIIVLWGFYSYRVKEATSPVKVPYAKVVLNATDEITEDDIGYTEVTSKFLKNAEIIKSSKDLIGKYVTIGTSIPEGGLFYSSQVVDKGSLPSSIFDDMEDGFLPFTLNVNITSTYGNKIYPGTKIDLWLKATDDNNKPLYGKFIESITVLAVLDSAGNNAFELGQSKTPAVLVFSVDEKMYQLLMKATYLSGVSLVPVPHNRNYSEAGGEVKTYEYLRNFIEAKTATIPTN